MNRVRKLASSLTLTLRLVVDICLLLSISGEPIFMKLENARLRRREFDGEGLIMLVSLNTLAVSFL